MCLGPRTTGLARHYQLGHTKNCNVPLLFTVLVNDIQERIDSCFTVYTDNINNEQNKHGSILQETTV